MLTYPPEPFRIKVTEPQGLRKSDLTGRFAKSSEV